MALLYLLEKIRFPFLNTLMLAVTQFGEETAFLVAALIVFWCVDKKKGYFIMAVGFLGTMLNQFLKLAFRIPRPWIRDPSFSIVEEAREAASGYSFPSGHSQSAVGTFGGIAAVSKNRWIRYTCIAIAVLVPFSRMYLGVHTPQDVLVGSACAVALIFGLKPVVFSKSEKPMVCLIGVMVATAALLLIYVECYPFPADVDAHNLASGVKNGYTMIGCLVGVCTVYFLERRFVRFETDAVWWAQILKILIGLALVLTVKEGLRSPLDALFAGHMIGRAVRYYLIVVTAGLLWPMTFQYFRKLGHK